jgi:hypothetical protein
VSRSDRVPRGAPDERAGSVDAVVVTEVGPPSAFARDELCGRLRPPSTETRRSLMRKRRTAELVVYEDEPRWRRLFRSKVVAVQQPCEAVRQGALS